MVMHRMYLLETLTNTCVGSGDTSFGTVDIMIQKDPVTFTPIFNSSSVKGAIREHMEQILLQDNIKAIFGDEKDKPGFVKFYDARLLLLPLRASQKVFYYSTSLSVLKDFKEALETFCKQDTTNFNAFLTTMENYLYSNDIDFAYLDGDSELEIEDFGHKGRKYKVEDIADGIKSSVANLLGLNNLNNLAVFNDDIFKDICENSLPVIARNKIKEDGTSENLFYEEVLPRRSKLWLMLGIKDGNNALYKIYNEFETKLTQDLIQFGGNASIGYGVTKINLLCKEEENEPKKD